MTSPIDSLPPRPPLLTRLPPWTRRLALGLLVLATTAGAYQAVPDPVNPDPRGKRPIDAVESVFLEDLTWMEVRDAMAAGKKTILVATGGVEQNGPYLATGKHNVILRGTTEAIARQLGNALVAPIIAFVPEGDFEPPSLHMKYPGTIGLSEETYRALLKDICRSFQVTGFETIVLIGDSGGNQDGMKAVAEELTAHWGQQGPRVLYIPEYWDYPGLEKWLADQGIVQTPEGLHDDFAITSQMLAVDPQTVRAAERQKAGLFKINGVDLAPVAKTAEWGRRIIQRRATQTVDAIHKALAK
ncbi:MAG: creatininase family protein [Planctomycetaceae bacterium]|jgi:creatinine amidohydrolase/Fe(II)-dependent formamide hydrolase-like protein